jgi:hypothetical protein
VNADALAAVATASDAKSAAEQKETAGDAREWPAPDLLGKRLRRLLDLAVDAAALPDPSAMSPVVGSGNVLAHRESKRAAAVAAAEAKAKGRHDGDGDAEMRPVRVSSRKRTRSAAELGHEQLVDGGETKISRSLLSLDGVQSAQAGHGWTPELVAGFIRTVCVFGVRVDADGRYASLLSSLGCFRRCLGCCVGICGARFARRCAWTRPGNRTWRCTFTCPRFCLVLR